MRLSAPLSALCVLALPAYAQDHALQFELGLGPRVSPSYEGSDEYVAGPSLGGSVQTLDWWIFNIARGDGLGFGFGPSFRYLGERDDNDHARLTGIDDVDAAFELGAQVSYRWPTAEVFGALRKGVTGHDGVVLDLGADMIFAPAARTELRVGPRVTFADEAYVDTYFSVPTGAVLPAYDADAGLHSVGLELSLRRDLSDVWAVEGTLGWSRLAGSVGDSPVVENRDQGSVGVMLIRKFDWRW